MSLTGRHLRSMTAVYEEYTSGQRKMQLVSGAIGMNTEIWGKGQDNTIGKVGMVEKTINGR